MTHDPNLGHATTNKIEYVKMWIISLTWTLCWSCFLLRSCWRCFPNLSLLLNRCHDTQFKFRCVCNLLIGTIEMTKDIGTNEIVLHLKLYWLLHRIGNITTRGTHKWLGPSVFVCVGFVLKQTIVCQRIIHRVNHTRSDGVKPDLKTILSLAWSEKDSPSKKNKNSPVCVYLSL